MNYLLKSALLGLASTGAYLFITRHMTRNNQPKPEAQPDRPFQQILKSTFLQVSTKQNMGIVSELYQLDCMQAESLLKPYVYTLGTGGKKVRLIMAVIVSEMFTGATHGRIPRQVLQVGGLIELLHSASLIIDDIEDGSLQRRGQPCSHLVYGMDAAINSANLMYFLPFRKLYDSISDPNVKLKILSIFMEEMILCHLGQAQDVLVHKADKKQELPQLEQYETLTIAKTSSLLRMMVRMLCVFLGRSEQQSDKLCQVMNYVGLAFQVTDDVLNLTKNLGKGDMAEDLKEKKFTPIINYMKDNEEFIQLFLGNDKDEVTINKMLEMIVKSDALSETKKLAQVYEQKAEELIGGLETPYSKSNFQRLMKFIITRQN